MPCENESPNPNGYPESLRTLVVLTNRNTDMMRLVLNVSKTICSAEVVSVFFVRECGLVERLGAFKDQVKLWGFINLSIKNYYKADF